MTGKILSAVRNKAHSYGPRRDRSCHDLGHAAAPLLICIALK